MGRKSMFEATELYDAVGEQLVATGRFTIQEFSEKTGISTGSIYHRFSSREALLAESWLHALRAFQPDFLKQLRGASLQAGELAALAIPRFCREHPRPAAVLACCRQTEFTSPETPSELVEQISKANLEVAEEVRKFAKRVNRSLLSCRLALAAYPLAAVRMYLPDQPVPPAVDDELSKAYRAALEVPQRT